MGRGNHVETVWQNFGSVNTFENIVREQLRGSSPIVWSLHFMQGNRSTIASYDSGRDRIHSTRLKISQSIAEDWVCRIAAWRTRREPCVLAGQGTNGPG